jgi:methanogenic corrinoid protein MtbC1
MTTLTDPLTEYFRAVAGFDPRGASDVVLQLLDDGTPLEQITTEILTPAQVRVGELWESGKWSVADEHVATSITERALAMLTYAATPRRDAHNRHVAVACAEGEWHSLPARMAAAVVGASGDARVTMLGPSIAVDQLHHRLSAGDIDVLALSCTLPTNLIGAARCIAAAHDLGVPVVAGGRAFGPDAHRARALGADSWATDATVLLGHLPELVGRSSDISPEVLALDLVDESLISVAYDRMVGAFPSLGDMSPYQQARTREDLRWMARFTAAALLTDDVRIIRDLLSWLCGLLAGTVRSSVIATSAHFLAETLEPDSAAGASLLDRAAASVEADALTGAGHDGED